MSILEIIIVAVISTLIGIIISILIEKDKKKYINNAHFYVARNKNGSLYLHIGKPFRAFERFDSLIHGSSIYLNWSYVFDYLGLNKKDYANLKWEDEPVEVFINMKD